MEKKKIFIDGLSGTTGLRIVERVRGRGDLELIEIDPARHRDPDARRECLNRADAVFLCLPDAAAIEAAAMVENPDTCVIDASTAHRVDPAWVYGFPEMEPGQRDKIRASKRIANTGCHASGFISIVRPLVYAGVLGPDALLTAHSLTGYSGGGKKMIAQYEDVTRDCALDSPRQYGLELNHKHLPEMRKYSGLLKEPAFCPIVADYYAGMAVSVCLFREMLKTPRTPDELLELYREHYAGEKLVSVVRGFEGGFMNANALKNTDRMEIHVMGNADRLLIASVFDNLGKGASGAAVQNMNLALGVDEYTSLVF